MTESSSTPSAGAASSALAPVLPIRLAILECDTPFEPLLTDYGPYSKLIVDRTLSPAVKTLSTSSLPGFDNKDDGSPPPLPEGILTITAHHVVPPSADLGWTPADHPDVRTGYPRLDDVDAILVSGSRHDAYSDEPWVCDLVAFVRTALDSRRVRVLGICFGHQIVARALGGQVGPTNFWEAAVYQVDLTERGKEVFGMDQMTIFQMHHDQVLKLPPGVESLGHTPLCPVHAMYEAGRFLTVQGHPEQFKEWLEPILRMRHAASFISDTDIAEGLRRIDLPYDGVAVGRAFVRFLMK